MRLIDSDKFLDALSMFKDNKHGNKHFMYGINTAMEILKSQPTIEDVFSVVKCKDCTFSKPSKSSISGIKCNLRGDFTFSNDYCSYAVNRRMNETN